MKFSLDPALLVGFSRWFFERQMWNSTSPEVRKGASGGTGVREEDAVSPVEAWGTLRLPSGFYDND